MLLLLVIGLSVIGAGIAFSAINRRNKTSRPADALSGHRTERSSNGLPPEDSGVLRSPRPTPLPRPEFTRPSAVKAGEEESDLDRDESIDPPSVPHGGSTVIQKCDEGHFYDSRQNPECPFCGADLRDSTRTTAFDQSAVGRVGGDRSNPRDDDASLRTTANPRNSPAPDPVDDGPRAVPRRQPVDLNAFAPNAVDRGTTFIIDIWLHAPEDHDEVAAFAREASRGKNIGRKGALSLENGVLVSIELRFDGLTVIDPLDWIEWNGRPANASFMVKVPDHCAYGPTFGTAILKVGGIYIAKMYLQVQISQDDDEQREKQLSLIRYPTSAFASYAHEDAIDVLKRIQGIRAIRPDLDVFLDVLTLRSGQNWEDEIRQRLTEKDMFLLFWSAPASRSAWVEKEWKMALSERGLDYIHPIPLESIERSLIPEPLASLHFMDPELLMIAGMKAREGGLYKES